MQHRYEYLSDTSPFSIPWLHENEVTPGHLLYGQSTISLTIVTFREKNINIFTIARLM
jgi:hypothetical protein